MKAIDLAITFRSDWHVGTGSGRAGSTDRLICRDHDGLPMIPGKTVAGMWRDAAESLATALDGSVGPGKCRFTEWVSYLFGDQIPTKDQLGAAPRPSRLRVGAGRLDPTIAGYLRGPSARILRDALTFVVASVAIDGTTLAAVEGALCMTEVARKELSIAVSATLDLPPGFAKDVATFAESFLRAAAEGIARIGGKRRRGRGECRVRAHGIADAAGPFFEELKKAGSSWPPELPKEPVSTVVVTGNARATAGSCYRVRAIRLEAVEALQIPLRTVGNVVESQKYVPGALIIPIVARDLGAKVDLFAALRDGELIIRNAYAVLGTQRGLPTPICLYGEKRGSKLRSGLAPGVDLAGYKQLRDGFVPREGGGNAPVRPQRVSLLSRTHNTVDDTMQRPGENGVYTYEAIAAGTVLCAELLTVAGSAIDGALEHAFAPGGAARIVQLGRSKNREYGTARLSVEGPREVVAEVRAPTRPEEVRLWLASPWLLRSATLRFEISAETLQAGFARALGFADDTGVKLVRDRSWMRPVRVDSWQRSWGLPRPSLVGVAAGSVLTFSVATQPADFRQRLERLVVAGIGERRGEGFGEVLVNPPWIEKSFDVPRETRSSGGGVDGEEDTATVPLLETATKLAEDPVGMVIVLAAARAEIERAAAVEKAPTDWDHRDVSNAVLGRLRAAIGSAPDERVVLEVETWLAENERPRGVGGLEKSLPKSLFLPIRSLLGLPSPDRRLPPEDAELWTDLGLGWLPRALRRELFPRAVQLVLSSWCRDHFSSRERREKEAGHGS